MSLPARAVRADLLELFNAGIPWSARQKGLLEICTDGVDALMAEVGSAESLASKLIHLIESPELAAQLRQAGYETLLGGIRNRW